MKNAAFLVAFALVTLSSLVSCCTVSVEPDGSSSESRELDGLWERAYDVYLKHHPEAATRQGVHDHDALLNDPSPQGHARYAEEIAALKAQLDGIDAPAARTSRTLLAGWLDGEAESHRRGQHVLRQLDPLHGFHTEQPRVFDMMRRRNAPDFEVAIARLRRVPAYVSGSIETMRAGIASGRTQSRPVVEKVLEQIRGQLVDDPTDHPFWTFFATLPKTVSDADAQRLAASARQVLHAEVLPALRRLEEFVAREYLPKTRAQVGVASLPGGAEYYAWRVREETTTDLDPDRIHEIGLGEVARIRSEMEAIRRKVGFDGDLTAFIAHLRVDPRFYYERAEDLLVGFRDICKRADAELPKLFGRLPRAPYGVIPIPEYAAGAATSAYYDAPAADGSRQGFFFVNTTSLSSRPKYEMEALALHEAVPGHHLQLALQLEFEGMPRLRARVMHLNGYVEGWGLYAERLGLEMGFYTDPYADFGRLSFEAWRACRLVVDTGLHQKGWTRQQAIDYMLANTALTRVNVEAEIDRYIVWPGQALGYKLGEIRIRELRAYAEKALGERFDLRAFHDLVLEDGAIPLDLLEKKVRAWTHLMMID